MKRNVFKYTIFIMLLFMVNVIFYNPPEKTYKLNILEKPENCFLIDDFKDKINNQYWNVIDRGDNFNEELQYFYPNNIRVDNNHLIITSKLENHKDYNYTSGLINTKDKFEFLYGKMIFRVKSPKGIGLLSAIWLLPADDSLFPEIDIIEVLGEKSNEVWSGVHYLDDIIINSDFNTTKVADNDFFVYELIWEKDEIRGYINNKLVYKTNNGVPDKPMYLIINLAVGGNWPKPVDDSIFPKEFLIDYVIIIPEKCDME